MAEDHVFCRLLLQTIMQDVRIVVPVEQRKKAWTYKHGFGNPRYEFHGPRDFYWYGQAHCKWDARVKGWEAYLKKYHPELENEMVEYEDVALAKLVE